MKKPLYQPYALATIFCWSLAFVFTRMTLSYFSAASLGFLRYLVASAALIVIAVIKKIKPPKPADWPLFLVSGFFGFFLYMIAFNKGLSSVPAATASVVNATVPVVTALIAGVVYREKVRGFQWVAVVIELIGIAVLTVMSGGLTQSGGLVWLFLAALSLSTYNILQRKLTKKYTAMQASTYSIFAGTLMLAFFSPTAFRELAAAPAAQYIYVALLGVFPSAIAYVSWSVAFSKAERTSQVSNFTVLTLFFTSLLGILILGETPNAATLVGGGITLAGVLLFNYGAAWLGKRRQAASIQ
jgi:drug/metabolite transporter (DMT)-like permease